MILQQISYILDYFPAFIKPLFVDTFVVRLIYITNGEGICCISMVMFELILLDVFICKPRAWKDSLEEQPKRRNMDMRF
jgi:hypothetical protein